MRVMVKLMNIREYFLFSILFLSRQRFCTGEYQLENFHLLYMSHHDIDSNHAKPISFNVSGFPMYFNKNCYFSYPTLITVYLKTKFSFERIELYFKEETSGWAYSVDVMDEQGNLKSCKPKCVPNVADKIIIFLKQTSNTLCQIKAFVNHMVTGGDNVALTTFEGELPKKILLPNIVIYLLSSMGFLIFVILISIIIIFCIYPIDYIKNFFETKVCCCRTRQFDDKTAANEEIKNVLKISEKDDKLNDKFFYNEAKKSLERKMSKKKKKSNKLRHNKDKFKQTKNEQ